MQGKGLIKFIAIVLGLVCLFELSFTLVTYRVEKKAKAYATNVDGVVDYAGEAAYLDSMSSEVVYNLLIAKFTYKECKEKEINLGLDLKGGMNVMLEVSVPDMVAAMANNSTDEAFVKAMNLAKQRMQTSSEEFVTLFASAFKEVSPDDGLSRVFGTYEMRDRINANTSDGEVITVLRSQVNAAVANSFNVLRSRIDRFGVTQPNLQRLGNSGRILVELPGVKEPERVRKLLQGTANLEFWETYENTELFNSLSEANSKLREIEDSKPENQKAKEEQTSSLDSLSLDGEESEAESAAQNPLFHVLMPSIDANTNQPVPGPRVGIAHYRDTSKIRKWLELAQIRSQFPRDVQFLWSIKPIDEAGNYYELIAIKANTRDGKAPLDGGVITDAYKNFSGANAYADVSMSMNSDGAKIWSRMTADNKGRCIAIVLDDYVYSYPRVNQEIKGGQSSISRSLLFA
ncbi:MAG: protein translocase subunit SecDF, partial [Prevotellaceae bacterium]|nr:protein translocase subunit SecDF [Prevotellaceae bacterium]